MSVSPSLTGWSDGDWNVMAALFVSLGGSEGYRNLTSRFVSLGGPRETGMSWWHWSHFSLTRFFPPTFP